MAHDVMDIPWETISGENPEPPPAPPVEPPTPEPPPAPADAPKPEDPPNPNPDAPPAGDPPPAPAPKPEPEPEPEPEDPTSKGRFRLEGPDAHFARLRREGVSAEDAIKIAYKQDTPPPDAPPENDPLKAVNEELATLQATLDAAAADESLITPDIRKAQRRESELLAEKRILELQQAQAADHARQQQGQQLQSDEAKSWEAAEGLFPDIKNENSALFKAVEAEWNAIAANPNHPMHSVVDLPEILTAKHAAKLRIHPAPATASPPTPPPAPPPKAPVPTPMQPVPGNAGVTNPPVQLTDAQRLASLTQNLAKAGTMKDAGKLLDEGLWQEKESEDFIFRH